MIHAKVANGYRATWPAKAEADVRTTVHVAKLNRAAAFDVIAATRT